MDKNNQVIGTTTTRLNLRAGPGPEYPVLEVLKRGAQVMVLEDLGAWLNVHSDSRIGYVDERYLAQHDTNNRTTEAVSPDDAASIKAVTTARVNLREGPGYEYPVLNTILPGTPVAVFEDMGSWLNILYAGRLAYVHADFVDMTGRSPAEQTGPALLQDSTAGEGAIGVANGELETRPDDEVENGYRVFGVTTAVLNLRGGPGTQYSVLNVLPECATLEILEDMGSWLDVRYEGVRGYVHENFVSITDSDPPLEIMQAPPAASPSPDEPPGAVGWESQLVAGIRMRHDSLLEDIGRGFGIEPGVAASVIAAETSLLSFGEDGRLALRFEPHIFWDLWGRRHPDRYALHFQHDESEPWEGHAFRADPSQRRWAGVHSGGQVAEWAAYELAASLDPDAAARSVRMGSPQIFGDRYSELGFDSVDEMFEAFTSGEAAQLRGLFDLISGPQKDSEGIRALRSGDFLAFARYFNGEAQGEKYGEILQKFYSCCQESE